MTSQITVSAPGKIIISGEHAVVYGYPALICAVNLYAKVGIEITKGNLDIYPDQAKDIVLRSLKNTERFLDTKFEGLKINLNSEIPIGCGMGLSAAVSVAVATALMNHKAGKIILKHINEIAYETEKYYHVNSSGADPAISTYGGFLWYRKETTNFKVLTPLKPKINLASFIIINTGKPDENTGQMVEGVLKFYKNNPAKTEKTFQKIENITRSFLRYLLKEESVSLTELIRENERYLEELEVVSDSTKSLIKKIEKIGGAAKITGAGGRKENSGILLAYHPDKKRLVTFVREKKLTVLPAKFTSKGVKVEKN